MKKILTLILALFGFGTAMAQGCFVQFYPFVVQGTTTVSFSTTSNPSATEISTWAWDFGDGTTSATQQNPPHVYSAPGTYTVCVSIVTNTGCTDDYCEDIVIPGTTTCTAAFSASISDLSVTFSDSSEGANTWSWNFGDGITSTQQNPTHTFSASGTYNVCLTITGDNACTDQTCSSISVVAPASCMADFLVSASDLAVTFSDNSEGANAWSWNFGDGTTSTQQNPTHTYASGGAYNVCLTISGSNGCSDQTCVMISVSQQTNSGSISGTVTDNEGNPLANATVTLTVSGTSTVVASAQTNADGTYSLQNVPLGAYILDVSLENYSYGSLTTVNLSALIPNLSNIDLEMQMVDGIQNVHLVENISIFPNPVSSFATVSIMSKENMPALLDVIDMQGKIVSSLAINLQIGENNVEVSANNLPSGMYWIALHNTNVVFATTNMFVAK
ncbi:MAG: PKD domain-containing protein [Chitinophagales bacterium]|nr:PKD domain-containing protein [Bacteroidota bacterium]MCB9042326.1 PKD domain-containing protein [Chitinophagales bacterium]